MGANASLTAISQEAGDGPSPFHGQRRAASRSLCAAYGEKDLTMLHRRAVYRVART